MCTTQTTVDRVEAYSIEPPFNTVNARGASHWRECMQRVRTCTELTDSHLSHLNGQQDSAKMLAQPRRLRKFGSMYDQACMEIVLLAESIPMDVHPLVHVLS